MTQIDIRAFLRHQPLFQQLSDEQLEGLVPSTQEVRGIKGQVVFQRGDVCDGMYLVVYGRVKLAITSSQGAEKVIEIINPGQSFAEAVMFLGQRYPVMAQLLEDSLLLHVASDSIIAAIHRDPVFACRLLSGLSQRLHGLVRDVERYSVENAIQRVIGYLLQNDEGGEEGVGHVVSLPVNKNLIASRLNLTPETFSRVLHQLSEAGLISVNGREIILINPRLLAGYGAQNGR
ncbi:MULTISPECIES: Crp/Fnr family transcriptional regulator [Gulbenkiania]|uniref:cAMP-binding domain of CRP or a regulatory subunit of cAMP-dependent protein kinases n=2 Tax=Gulbenkiania TaxID=397456 RepID=A0A0K6GUY2_9NEIS|nr:MULTISPECIES: Crp/Fnr family transcriptional regulator [Gulbenkiania]TCW33990.1 CRP-like cAMP-binding protein [Gulbenkiania mobilis]CUA82359.1 cAMP-binding domain of CRP or a regulatory subunit of cAMP-dependent protein kinases [Gulbenkiania indica]